MKFRNETTKDLIESYREQGRERKRKLENV